MGSWLGYSKVRKTYWIISSKKKTNVRLKANVLFDQRLRDGAQRNERNKQSGGDHNAKHSTALACIWAMGTFLRSAEKRSQWLQSGWERGKNQRKYCKFSLRFYSPSQHILTRLYATVNRTKRSPLPFFYYLKSQFFEWTQPSTGTQIRIKNSNKKKNGTAIN